MLPDKSTEPVEDLHALFQPDYTPEQLESLGVYDALYRGQAPRLASLGAWKPEWLSEHDPKGWAQWYKRYAGGRRLEGEDERQIKRWMSFKARHGGPFSKKPTPRRGWALRNWAIDPANLVTSEARNGVVEMLDDHQRKAMQKFVQQKVAELNPDVQLQEHQQRVSDRISQDDSRLLLYHGLGTGKSLSAIAAAEAAKKVHGGQYGVVVPASLKQNFQKELDKFTSDSNPEILSYTGLALGKKFQQPPETLVMDEAQRLKNPESASAVAARNLAAQAKRVVLLSGTPITNSPGDLASPLSILRNENITPEDFEKKYVGYEKKFPGIIPYLRGADYGEEPFVKNEPQLRDMLAGKVDYQPGKLPEGVRVNEETVRVPLSPEQRRIQKAVRTKIPPGFLWKMDQEFPLSREELSKLNSFMTGMRQVSLSTQPFRADKSPLKAFEQSSKLREAMKRLRENLDADPRRKAIIYSNFIDAGINPYAAALERDKIPYGVFHGGIAARARQKALADYNAGKLRALLLGPAAAEGISTKGTSLIQLLDPYWHESRTQQARGRGLRFDSHAGLPDDLKDVSVQRYLSASEEPHFLARLIGKRRERTGDEVMQHLADKKEQLNEKFRAILREVGSEKAADEEKMAEHSKAAAAGWGQVAKRLATNAARFGVGGAAGYYANDKYLDQVNPGDPNNEQDPGVSNMGRMRSNLLSAALGGTLASKGVGRSLYRAQPFSVSMKPHARLGRIPSVKVRPTVGTAGWLTGGAAAAGRYGVIMPDMKHSPVGFGLGDVLDPGHSVLPKAVATVKDKSTTDKAVDFMTRPVENLSNWATKNYVTPGLLNGVITGLGGEARKAPTVGDVGMTLAPHFAGGAGGAYLGTLAGEGLGDFIFRDNPKEDYEERRRQEQRRWWLQFLGGNLGAIGGAAATMGSMPHINKIINQYMTAKKTEKQSGVGAALGRAVLGLGRDAALAGGITAGQYAAGIVPPGSYGSDGKAGPQANDFFGAGTLPLFGANLLATRATGLGGKITGSRTFTGPHRVRTNPIVSGLATGGLLTAMPSVVNTVSSFPALHKATKQWAENDNQSAFARDTGGALSGSMNWTDLGLAGGRGALRGITGAEPQSLADAAKANKAKAGTDEADLANNAAAAGKEQAKKFLTSTGAGTVAMGTGMTAGGIAGMTAGEWLVDKLLTAGVNKKWLKKRKHLHHFLRDIGSLTGMGLGAYGGLKAMDYATPAVMQYFNSKQPAAAPAKKA